MPQICFFGVRGTAILLVSALVFLLSDAQTRADLAHRYSFTTDASDSIGGMNGNVIDAGTNSNHAFTAGQLDLSANNGEGSDNISEDAYVDLPNGLVSNAVSTGTNGAVSFEWWATVATTRTWQRFGDFGSSNGGEDTSPSGENTDYVLITPNSGRHNNGLEMTNHPASGAGEPNVGLSGPFPENEETHVVAVYDHNDPTGGPNGTMSLYFDGSLVGTNLIHPDLDMRTMNDNNNWLGRSQWNDPVFDGSYNEFRVYDHAVDAAQVAFNNLLGPDQALAPGDLLTLSVDPYSGQVQLNNDVGIDLAIEYYEIRSAGDALNDVGWNSLADQDGQPGAGLGWDESAGSGEGQLIEFYLGDPNGAQGDTISANTQRSLGAAFDPSVFGAGNDGDLTFSFGLPGGNGLLTGSVVYEINPDRDGDGDVDGRDFLLGQQGPGFDLFFPVWQANYGSAAAIATSAVPEPATAVGVAMMAGVWAAIRRRMP